MSREPQTVKLSGTLNGKRVELMTVRQISEVPPSWDDPPTDVRRHTYGPCSYFINGEPVTESEYRAMVDRLWPERFHR